MVKLVTFGCSWTYGIGSTYVDGIPQEQYTKIRKDDTNSFRKILCERHNFSNVNFSQGGSSNQRQFRLATEYFNKPIEEETIVLWGITSTARNEFWSNHKGKICSIHYNICTSNPLEELSDLMRRNHYNHESEVSILTERMLHWNNYFRMLGVKNYWFDTFSHNDYDIPNMCWRDEKPRDLLSKLCEQEGMTVRDDSYHYSIWKEDCDRIEYLLDKQVVNQISHHPNQKGHQMIADMFDKIFL